ncbi:Uncharacterized protein SCF082_LOCUS39076 [Durusdinium trenchii]|uniref:Uncharacterized protein n=1 Tax=Durusdinium trenchii TaxID=1381693 RepID=A0ABP0Q1Q1_9DINO
MKLQLVLFASFLPGLVHAWWGNPRRRRTRVQVCNDVVKPVVESVWSCQPAKTRTAWRDVTKWHKTKKNVTKWMNASRWVVHTETIEYTLPLEDFVLLAKEQITEEVLASLKSGIAPNSHLDSRGDDLSNEEVAHIVWGPSQAGKSTLICQCRQHDEDPCPEVGDGSGESQTSDISMWQTTFGFTLDTMGLGDSLLRFSKEEIGKLVAAGISSVAAANIKRVKFLVFESMANDALHLRNTLLNLFTAFGEEVRNGIVVIASKPNLRQGRAGVQRLVLMQQVMAEQGLRELVLWRGPEKDQESVEELKAALGRVSSAEISALDDLWDRVNRRAQELFEQQVPRTKNISVDVLEEYLIPEEVEEEVEEKYVESEPVLEQYEGETCEWSNLQKDTIVRECKLH